MCAGSQTPNPHRPPPFRAASVCCACRAAFTIRSLMPVDLVNPNATRCAPLPYNATTVADIAPELDCYARYPAGARPA